ncbi:unnamed protein product [Closterium sp. Naga37s-1]|nr:unnamed protein product [Closterium sp. Naga37s-1]
MQICKGGASSFSPPCLVPSTPSSPYLSSISLGMHSEMNPYHSECIVNWIFKHPVCPVCKGAAFVLESGEVGAGEVGAGEVGAGEVGGGVVDVGDGGAGEADAGEVGGGEVDAGEVGRGEVDAAGELGRGEVDAGEADSGEVGTGEMNAGECTVRSVLTGARHSEGFEPGGESTGRNRTQRL